MSVGPEDDKQSSAKTLKILQGRETFSSDREERTPSPGKAYLAESRSSKPLASHMPK